MSTWKLALFPVVSLLAACGAAEPLDAGGAGDARAPEPAGAREVPAVDGPGAPPPVEVAAPDPSRPAEPARPAPTCAVPRLPKTGRPVEILPAARLADVAARMPCVGDPALVALLESPDTMWYDKRSIVPGYQDSHGDNVVTPIGMRPNTIEPQLIVTGGHEALFEKVGEFHFPFGKPIGVDAERIAIVDFWRLPRGARNEILPAAYWVREPNGYTHRYEWVFPVGTVFGELLSLVAPDGTRWVFEIRTRTRTIDGWTVDAFRPFRDAAELATALAEKRKERLAWASAADVDALIAHLRDPATLAPGALTSAHFAASFPRLDGASDELPALRDPTLLQALLREHPFRSAKGAVWKSQGARKAYGASTKASFHVVPAGYNAGFFAVDDAACSTCHRDAGRPFQDYYPFVTLYGELWGGDETFSWHPFETANFVDGAGSVVDFNYDNRKIRADFVAGKVVERYDATKHPRTAYKQIPRPWVNFAY